MLLHVPQVSSSKKDTKWWDINFWLFFHESPDFKLYFYVGLVWFSGSEEFDQLNEPSARLHVPQGVPRAYYFMRHSSYQKHQEGLYLIFHT